MQALPKPAGISLSQRGQETRPRSKHFLHSAGPSAETITLSRLQAEQHALFIFD